MNLRFPLLIPTILTISATVAFALDPLPNDTELQPTPATTPTDASSSDEIASPHNAVVEILNQVGRVNPSGSGAYIRSLSGGKGHVLTCDHIWHKTKPDPRNRGNEVYAGRNVGKITCTFPSGFSTPAKLLKYDEGMDVSLLEIQSTPPNTCPAPLVVLKESDAPYTVIGHPFNSPGQRWRQGRLLKWWNRREVCISADTISGYSGGPLVNRYGEVVGVATSRNPRNHTSTHTAGDDLVRFASVSTPSPSPITSPAPTKPPSTNHSSTNKPYCPHCQNPNFR